MRVNTLSIALVALFASAVPSLAATLPAEIEGHNVYSRFLPGAFIPLPPDQSQQTVSPPAAPPASPLVLDDIPNMLDTNEASSNTVNSQSGMTLPWPSNPPGKGTSDPIIGGGGSNPGGGVGTVPLPGTLPMFGFALLALCGLGVRSRRRVARAHG